MNNLEPTVKTILLGAAKLLRERQWITGLSISPDQQAMCMVGAIGLATEHPDPVVRDNLYSDAINAVTYEIWRQHPELNHPHVTAWNDRHCRSKDEAIAMLEAAA